VFWKNLNAYTLLLHCYFLLLLAGCSSPPGFIENQLADDLHGYYISNQDEVGPGILLLVGGSGYKPIYSEIASYFANEGYKVLIADHFGGGDDWKRFGFDTVEDYQAYSENALRGIEYLSTQEDVDDSCIGILGFSFGAVIAFNAAYETDEVDVIVDMYGYMMKGWTDGLDDEEFVSAMPPICIIHGDQDKTVSLERGQEVYDLLQEYSIESEMHILEGADHAFIYDDAYLNEALPLALQCFDRYLK